MRGDKKWLEMTTRSRESQMGGIENSIAIEELEESNIRKIEKIIEY